MYLRASGQVPEVPISAAGAARVSTPAAPPFLCRWLGPPARVAPPTNRRPAARPPDRRPRRGEKGRCAQRDRRRALLGTRSPLRLAVVAIAGLSGRESDCRCPSDGSWAVGETPSGCIRRTEALEAVVRRTRASLHPRCALELPTYFSMSLMPPGPTRVDGPARPVARTVYRKTGIHGCPGRRNAAGEP